MSESLDAEKQETNTSLWEILVPTIHGHHPFNPVKVRHHRIWDKFVRQLTGGLTICIPTKGIWVSPTNEIFTERMIPVRIMCTKEQIEKVAEFTISHYRQQAVMYYKLTDTCVIKYANK